MNYYGKPIALDLLSDEQLVHCTLRGCNKTNDLRIHRGTGTRTRNLSVETQIKRIQKFGILLVKSQSSLKLQAQSIATEIDLRLSFVHLRSHRSTELAAVESKKVVTCEDLHLYTDPPVKSTDQSSFPKSRCSDHV